MIAHLSDKRLMGHVLAGRYQRHAATLQELQSWLAAYRDLPQAASLYEQARTMPGGKNAKLTRPMTITAMSGGGYGYDTGTGFRAKGSKAGFSPVSRRAASKIEAVLRQGDPATAKTLLEATVQQTPLSPQEIAPLQARLAAGFLYKGDSEEARRLTEADYMQNTPRAHWVSGLAAYQQGDYAAAASSFKTLAERDDLADSDHAAAAFWAYRSIKQMGASPEAVRWLEEAARKPRSFYGLLASKVKDTSLESSWSWNLPEFDTRSFDVLMRNPAGVRAMALAQVGQHDLAESELLRVNPQGKATLQNAMLAFAEKNNMASLALKLGNIATNDAGRAYDAALYPVPSWQPKGGYKVDRALMYALMRHESQFDPTAVSSQGACGLMQLMPATAERMNGKSLKHSHGECPDQFFEPVTNIGLGQRYVRHLAEQPMIGDNLLLLLAAYNGGPGRLLSRTGTDEDSDPLLFMESLPAQETHDYVQQVLMQYWTYRARLHLPLKSLDQLAHGEWPRYALHDTAPVVRQAEITSTAESFAIASNMTVH